MGSRGCGGSRGVSAGAAVQRSVPGMFGRAYCGSCSRHPRRRRFQPQGRRESKRETGVSAPYRGGLVVTPLQKARSNWSSSRWPAVRN
jgi:hypothetical protein